LRLNFRVFITPLPVRRLFVSLEAVGKILLVDEDTWAGVRQSELSDSKRQNNAHGIGAELFGGMRRNVLSAEGRNRLFDKLCKYK
jgi:hypothetical protein